MNLALFALVAPIIGSIHVGPTWLDTFNRLLGTTFLLNVPVYSVIAIIAAAGLGSWFVQSAYATGPPDLVIAGLTVVDPIVGIAVGIVVLGELQPNVESVIAISMGAAAIVAIVGVIALSRHHPDVVRRQKEARRR